jgi:2-hydroxychromene-2-carboxylate isomerase
MHHLDFWFDPVSPFAHLAFERLPQVLEGHSYEIRYRPILFAQLLKTWGQKGPAEIEPKRAWTFRQVHWLAHRHGVRLDTPVAHPFNPLAHLRLLWACAPPGGTPNRRACEAVLRHIWHGGADANDPVRLAALHQALAPARPIDDPGVKDDLRNATQQAVDKGIFGVPTIEASGRLFWGLDSLPMLRACLDADPWFDTPAWTREGAPRDGVRR